MTPELEAVARALQEAASKFGSPVSIYVESEARDRFEAANPDADAFDQGRDWAIDSWAILARAALLATGSANSMLKDITHLPQSN